MNDYIKREDAIKAYSKAFNLADDCIEYASVILKDIPPADVVEVVRCKDCKWFHRIGCAIEISDKSDEPTDDDYCSFGERGRHMSRYIDADKMKIIYASKDVEKYADAFNKLVDAIPTADVRENVQLDDCPLYGGVCGYPSGECYDCPKHGNFRENVRGEWQKVDEQPYFRKHFHKVCCSVCRKQGYDYWNFCPNCGADMRGDNNGKRNDS